MLIINCCLNYKIHSIILSPILTDLDSSDDINIYIHFPSLLNHKIGDAILTVVSKDKS